MTGEIVKRIGEGHKLYCSPAGSTSSSDFVEVGGIVDAMSSDASTPDVETTLLNDAYATFTPGQIDPGSISFELARSPESDVNKSMVDLFNDPCPTSLWEIEYPAACGSTETPQRRRFSGYVNKLGEKIEKGKLSTFEVQIKVSGNSGFST